MVIRVPINVQVARCKASTSIPDAEDAKVSRRTQKKPF